MNFLKKTFSKYVQRWWIPAGLQLGLFVAWFAESHLAFGPGWDKWWLLALMTNGLGFLIVMLTSKDVTKWKLIMAFLLCVILQLGGCHVYAKVFPAPPECDQSYFAEYDRFVLGRYSDAVPVGSWDIAFRYYDGLFCGRSVKCKVSERDFKWFCWRNKYPIHKGRGFINVSTGKPPATTWFGDAMEEANENCYSYFKYDERSCAGYKMIYDVKTQTLQFNWSTN